MNADRFQGREKWLKGLVALGVLTCCAVGGLWMMWPSLAGGANSSEKENTVVVGTKFPPIRGERWNSTDRTLVLALHIGCIHCEREMKFYEKLVSLSQKNGSASVRIVAIFPDSEEQVSTEYSRRLVGVEKTSGVDFSQLHVLGTPTLILLNRDGVVQGRWIGELSPADKQEVLKATRLDSNASS